MSQPNPQKGNSQQGLGSRIDAHFASHGGVELDLSNLRDLDADLKRRARIAALFLEGKWGVELETHEADEERKRRQAVRAHEPAPA